MSDESSKGSYDALSDSSYEDDFRANRQTVGELLAEEPQANKMIVEGKVPPI